MFRISKSAAMGLLLTLVCMASLAHAKDKSEYALRAPPAGTLEEYLREPEVRSISLSPDGKKLALIKRVDEERYQLLTMDIDGPIRPIARLDEPNGQKLYGVRWLTNGRLGLSVQKGKTRGTVDHHYYGLTVIDANGQNSVGIPGNTGLSRITAVLPEMPDHIITRRYDGYDRKLCLFRTNINTGKSDKVVCGGRRTIAFRVSETGEPVLRFDYLKVARNLKILSYNSDTDKWSIAATIELKDDEDADDYERPLATIEGDSTILIFERRDGDENHKLHRFDIKKQEYVGIAFELEDKDLHTVFTHRDSNQVIGASYITDKEEYKFLDDRLQKIYSFLERKFPGSEVDISSFSDNYEKILFRVLPAWRTGSYYLYNDQTRNILELVDLAPHLRRKLTTTIEKIRYRTPDDLEIESYLTYPSNRLHEKLPLIVFPHGGPGAHDWKTYDTFSQYWATRGYAIFQPNFRGSTERGRAFEEAGNHEYGGKMIDDIEVGIRTLVAQGRVDPSRICAAGISYGGYAALMLAIKTDLLKCAVSINGPVDWKLRIRNVSNRQEGQPQRIAWREWSDKTIGNIDTQPTLLQEYSALYRAAEISAPVLLIHAVDDRNVDIGHSKKLYRALKKAKKDVKFIKLADGGHSLWDEEAEERALKETEAFFAKHLKAAKKTSKTK